MQNYSTDEVRIAATGRWKEILIRLGYEERYLKNEHGPCPNCGGKDRWRWDDKDGSGSGFCNQCEITGDGFKLASVKLRLNYRRDFPQVLEAIARILNLLPSANLKQFPRNKSYSKLRVKELWEQSSDIGSSTDNLANRYLKNRGITNFSSSEALRFHQNLPYYEGNNLIGVFPALVAQITDFNGNLNGIHRTYLNEQGLKAEVSNPKKVMGSLDGFIMLDRPFDVLNIAEGIETALSVREATKLPTWSLVSSSNFKKFKAPTSVRTVHIWADNDLNGTGISSAHELANMLIADSIAVFIHVPEDLPGKTSSVDWNDIYHQSSKGPILNALAGDPKFSVPNDSGLEKPVTVILSGQDSNKLKSLWAAVGVSNSKKPELFLYGSRLVTINGGEAQTFISGFNLEQFKEWLTGKIDWKKYTKVKGDSGDAFVEVDQPLPVSIVTMAFHSPKELPRLDKVAMTPIFGRSGNLIFRDGYDQADYIFIKGVSQILLNRREEMGPSERLVWAKKKLFEDLLGDFSFACASDKAHFLCLLIQPFLRLMIDGTTPLYSIEASSKGAGKTLLVDLLSIVHSGIEASSRPFPEDENERRKTITSMLKEGTELAFFDNVPTGTLDSATLAWVLTSRFIKDRLLGSNSEINAPNLATWVITGNNLSYSTEIARRTVVIRLVPKVSNPWATKRTSFRHIDIRKWAKENRGDLISALLIFVEYWIHLGKLPSAKDESLGSFESWAYLFGGILDSCGVEGFLEGRQEQLIERDDEASDLEEIFELWQMVFGSKIIRPSDLLTDSRLYKALSIKLKEDRETALLSKLGKFLFAQRDAIFGQYQLKLVRDGGLKRGRWYSLIQTSPPTVNVEENQQLKFDGGEVGDQLLSMEDCCER